MSSISARVILITGASSGIGEHAALAFAGDGHRVFATARREEDLQRLDAIDNVIAVELDVRMPEQIEAAVRRIESEAGRLDGLVNNAGIAGLGPLASWSDADLQHIFDINVFGVHRMTNACLPLLIAARGRVVNIGSQAGSISMADFGPYTMTKHALEAYTIALADELSAHGVRVSIVQPGGIVSKIAANGHDETIARLRAAPEPFRAGARQLADAMEHPTPPDPDAPESAENRKPSSPQITTNAIIHALFDPEPHERYLVGTRWEGMRVITMLARRLADANRCPSLRLGRGEVVGVLEGVMG